jgi:Flp pilus assembly CpaE family ATPase
MTYGVRLCTFTSALGDASAKERTQPRRILAILNRNPRFSVFDVNHDSLAKTLDYLKDADFMVYKKGGHYPWCEIQVTPAGRKFLAGQE